MTCEEDDTLRVTRETVRRQARTPAAYEQLGLLLEREGRLPEAEDTFRRAVELAPNHAGLRVHLARALRERGMLSASLAQIERAASLAPALDWLRDALAARQAEFDAVAAHGLLAQFESLGDNCEFGIAQRGYGAEPLSLLRWCAVPLAGLLRGLQARFEGFGEADNVIVEEVASGELVTVDKMYGLRGHTDRMSGSIDVEIFRARECERLRFLCDKLIEDLEAAEKVFVYKTAPHLAEEQIIMLAEAVRCYGPNTLLWVTQADKEHCAGAVEMAGDGLLKGWVSRLADAARVPETTMAREWYAICAKARWMHARAGCPAPARG